MFARWQPILSTLLLVAIGLPGSLGVALHGLAPHANETERVESASKCSCCCDCKPADQPVFTAAHDCLICKFLAATKQTTETAPAVASCDLPTADLVTLQVNSRPFSYALPISARGPPA